MVRPRRRTVGWHVGDAEVAADLGDTLAVEGGIGVVVDLTHHLLSHIRRSVLGIGGPLPGCRCREDWRQEAAMRCRVGARRDQNAGREKPVNAPMSSHHLHLDQSTTVRAAPEACDTTDRPAAQADDLGAGPRRSGVRSATTTPSLRS